MIFVPSESRRGIRLRAIEIVEAVCTFFLRAELKISDRAGSLSVDKKLEVNLPPKHRTELEVTFHRYGQSLERTQPP